MASDFWKQFGDTYDQVNKKTGGVADFVKNQVIPRVGAAVTSFNKNMMESPVGQLAQKVADPISDALDPSWRQRQVAIDQMTENLRQQYPVAAGIGEAGAMAGQMLATPTVPAAEAGSIGAKLVPTLARNALNAGAMAVPGAVQQGVNTGDWLGAAKQGLINTGIGTALGTAGEKILGAVPALANALKKTLTGQAIRGGLDIDTRALRKVATYGPIGKFAGAVLDRVEDLKQQLVNLMVDHPEIKTELGRQNLIKQMDANWGKVDEAFNQYRPPGNVGKVRSFQNEILSHPLVQDAVNSNPELLGTLDDMITKADSGKDLAATRHILQKDYIDPSYAPGSKTDDEQVADLARGIHDVIDDHFVPDQLKETYGRDKVIKEALAREDLKLPTATSAGSPTFARLAASAAMGGMGGGAGLIAGEDPEQALRTAALTAGAGVVGGVGGRLGSRLINKGISGGQARLAQLLGNVPESALQGAEQAAPRLAQLGAKFPQMGQVGQPQQLLQEPQQPIPVAATNPDLTQAGAPAANPTDARAALNEPENLPPEHAADIQEATLKEQDLTPKQVADAKKAAITPFEESIKRKMLNDWNNWQNPYKADFDTFFEQAKASTNNFDPKNTNTAKIIAGPDYKTYLKSYNVALNLQSLGKDLVNAINYNPNLPMFWTGAEAKQKHDQLVNTLYTAMTGDMKDPDKTTRGSIENTLKTLRREGSGSKKAQQLFDMLENEYGVRFDMLRQYGAI